VDGANCDFFTKELAIAGRAIGLDLRTAWQVALRADLRRAVRSILKVVGGKRGSWGERRVEIDDVEAPSARTSSKI
jgi:hypothetical protein